MNCVIWQYANEIEINCLENLTEFFLGFFFLDIKKWLEKVEKNDWTHHCQVDGAVNVVLLIKTLSSLVNPKNC